MFRGRTRREQTASPLSRESVVQVMRCGGMRKWRIQERGMQSMSGEKRGWWLRPLLNVTTLTLLLLLVLSSPVGAQSASWRVGRGSIYGVNAGSGLNVKISLRNAGAPSSDAVRIVGRWTRSQPGRTNPSVSDLAHFVELGIFTREVSMKQTVILVMKLAPLGSSPTGGETLEIAVVTGGEVTDGVVIPRN